MKNDLLRGFIRNAVALAILFGFLGGFWWGLLQFGYLITGVYVAAVAVGYIIIDLTLWLRGKRHQEASCRP